MRANINFKYFSQNVSVGYCLILLGMTIAGVYAAVDSAGRTLDYNFGGVLY
ncbi:MAG: hypothetical protein ACLUNO_05395 [Oscillospiraceae bacterium]